MNPTKYQEIISKTAKQFQLDEQFLKELIDEYYKEVRVELSEINKTRLCIFGLGYFDLKFWKIKYALADTVNFIRYHEKSDGERSKAIAANLRRKLETLNRAQVLAEERIYKTVEKRAERKRYISKSKDDLEEQMEDPGRGLE